VLARSRRPAGSRQTYNTHDTQAAQETNSLSYAQFEIHGAGEEYRPEGEGRATEVVACEEGRSILGVRHGHICWKSISEVIRKHHGGIGDNLQKTA